jgi:hypothetical protein
MANAFGCLFSEIDEHRQWTECLAMLGRAKSFRGRPQRWDEETVLAHVLHVLSTGVIWARRGSSSEPSGAHCLRRLRHWQQDGRWNAFVDALRRFRRTSAVMASLLSDNEIDRWCVRAARENEPHSRPARRRRLPRTRPERVNPLDSQPAVHQLRRRPWWNSVVEHIRGGWDARHDKAITLQTVLAALARDRGWTWPSTEGRPGGRICLRHLRLWKARETGGRAGTVWARIVDDLREHLDWETGEIERIWVDEGLIDRIAARALRVSAHARKRANTMRQSLSASPTE